MIGTVSRAVSTVGLQALSQAFSSAAKEIGRVATRGNPNANVAVVAILVIGAVAGGAFWANAGKDA